jgi:hypothetical protein
MTLPSPRLPLPTSRNQSRTADNFDDLYDSLEDDEKAFFDLLSRELEKVENFYIAREREAIKRAEELKNQLNILAEHRKIYHELYPDGLTEWEVSLGRMVPAARGPVSLTHKAAKKIMPFVRNDTWEADPKQKKPNGRASPQLNGNGDGRINGDLNAVREAMIADKDHKTYSPERYTKHKKELRGACQEFYRHLERIKNYRVSHRLPWSTLLTTDYEHDWIPESFKEIRKDDTDALYGYVDRSVPWQTGFLEWREG